MGYPGQAEADFLEKLESAVCCQPSLRPLSVFEIQKCLQHRLVDSLDAARARNANSTLVTNVHHKDCPTAVDIHYGCLCATTWLREWEEMQDALHHPNCSVRAGGTICNCRPGNGPEIRQRRVAITEMVHKEGCAARRNTDNPCDCEAWGPRADKRAFTAAPVQNAEPVGYVAEGAHAGEPVVLKDNSTKKVSDRFNELLDEIRDLYDRKAADYASNDNDLDNNLRIATQIGVPSWVGTYIRTMDKQQRGRVLIRRLNLMREGPKVLDEPLQNTLRDEAVYNLLEIQLLEDAGVTNPGLFRILKWEAINALLTIVELEKAGLA